MVEVKFTKEELDVLWQMLNQVNLPGSIAEIWVELKRKVAEAKQIAGGNAVSG